MLRRLCFHQHQVAKLGLPKPGKISMFLLPIWRLDNIGWSVRKGNEASIVFSEAWRGIWTCLPGSPPSEQMPEANTSNLPACTKCSSAFWAQFGLRHFTCKFPYKVALVKCWHAFRRRRLAQSLRRGFCLWHFTCKFPYNVALVKCWHAVPLRRLSQSVCPGSGLNLGRGVLRAFYL